MRRSLFVLVAASLVFAACGDDDGESTDMTSIPATQVESTPSTETSNTMAPSTTGGQSAPTDLPGEPIDIFPYEGDSLAVVGVAADDFLNVRVAPGASYDLAAELDSLESGFTATGNNRQLDDRSIWAEIDTSERVGWAHTAYLAYLGSTDDTTANLYPGSDLPSAGSLEELGDLVAAQSAGDEGPAPDVVVVHGPIVGDLGEVIVDVLGYADDSILGERHHIFAAKDGSGFRLKSVETTTLCIRGVSDGLCL